MTFKHITTVMLGLLMIGSIAAEVPVIEVGTPILSPTAWHNVSENLYGVASNMWVGAKEVVNYAMNCVGAKEVVKPAIYPKIGSFGKFAEDVSKLALDGSAFLAKHPVAYVLAGCVGIYTIIQLRKLYKRGIRNILCWGARNQHVEKEVIVKTRTTES